MNLRRVPGGVRSWLDRATVSVAALVAVEAILLGLLLWGVFEFRDDVEERANSREAINAADLAMISLLNAETGQRGYLLTGDTSFLEPFVESERLTRAAVAELAELTAGDPDQAADVAALEVTVDAKFAELNRSIELFATDPDAALAVIKTGVGQQLMDDARVQLGSIRSREDERLDDQIEEENQTAAFVAVTASALTAVTLALIVVVGLGVRRRHEAEVLRQASMAKDEFVGFVSHELRNPILVISGNARLLDAEPNVPAAEREEAIAEIQREADRLNAIVSTLLNLARAESGLPLETEPLLIQRLLPPVVRRHRMRNPGREVVVADLDGAPPVVGNGDAVEQVLLNLLSNAEKYGTRDMPIRVTAAPSADGVAVSVENDGPKLDPEAFARVFEAFFRMPAQAATAPGIGLGLTVCHRLVAAQGGEMRAEALAEGGARFTFTLPVAPLEDE